MTYAYHQGMLRPYQVGAFAYVIPSAADNDCIIICIDMVLTMWWVASTKFLCALLETLTDVANDLVLTSIMVPGYDAIVKNLKIGPGPPYTLDSLTHITSGCASFSTFRKNSTRVRQVSTAPRTGRSPQIPCILDTPSLISFRQSVRRIQTRA